MIAGSNPAALTKFKVNKMSDFERDFQLMQCVLNGDTCGDAGKKFGISRGRVYQIYRANLAKACKRLGLKGVRYREVVGTPVVEARKRSGEFLPLFKSLC